MGFVYSMGLRWLGHVEECCDKMLLNMKVLEWREMHKMEGDKKNR